MEISITLLNLGYAIVGALLTLVFMMIGYKMFDIRTNLTQIYAPVCGS